MFLATININSYADQIQPFDTSLYGPGRALSTERAHDPDMQSARSAAPSCTRLSSHWPMHTHHTCKPQHTWPRDAIR